MATKKSSYYAHLPMESREILRKLSSRTEMWRLSYSFNEKDIVSYELEHVTKELSKSTEVAECIRFEKEDRSAITRLLDNCLVDRCPATLKHGCLVINKYGRKANAELNAQ